MRRPVPILLAAFAIWLAPAPPAGADLIGSHGDWEAYKETEGGKPVCYIGSEPKKAQGKYTRRGETYVLITHRPAEKSSGVVSVKAGYTYRKGSEVDITLGAETFKLFTDKGHAFAYDEKTDAALVKAMIRGATMVVKGTSSRGTLTTDTYSLKGFTAAYEAINRACGIK
ncbi:MAG: invasion associated locus B family protein [Rhodospirillales bacterium]